MNDLSPAQRLALLPKEERQKIIGSFSEEEKQSLLYSWRTWGRPSQLAPEWRWRVWLLLAGRGFGKTSRS